MPNIATFEAESTLGPLLDRVQSGEQILITRQGKTVARLGPDPAQKPIDREQVKAAMESIRKMAAEAKIPFDWEDLRRDRDAGRP